MAVEWIQMHNRRTGGTITVPKRDKSVWQKKGFSLKGGDAEPLLISQLPPGHIPAPADESALAAEAEPAAVPEATEPVLGKGGPVADPSKSRLESAAEPKKNKE